MQLTHIIYSLATTYVASKITIPTDFRILLKEIIYATLTPEPYCNELCMSDGNLPFVLALQRRHCVTSTSTWQTTFPTMTSTLVRLSCVWQRVFCSSSPQVPHSLTAASLIVRLSEYLQKSHRFPFFLCFFCNKGFLEIISVTTFLQKCHALFCVFKILSRLISSLLRMD